MTREHVRLDLRGVNPGKYTLECGVFEGNTPIKLGMNDDTYDDGWYRLGEFDI
ncbi:MAG: hypothetical protein HUJ65_04140 [Oscillospiraceae bacterium]|nr:hypothetical protein [Oscillospiraceae bacterium]